MQAVIDQPLKIKAAGTIAGANATPANTGQMGEGYLTLSLDPGASGPAYIGVTGVTSSTGLPLWPGQNRTVRYVDVAAIYVLTSGAGDKLGWIVEHE